ncbi:putative btb poz-like protein [Diplodia seriata]|uniref:Putative btb poz-like protein n=1 Tax=Diplodia seriata TaxID=420778 RepID=A0A0G2ELN0_9PEZI|nr:putative btb poz-like protein [Diplodia seriata]
MASRGIVDDPAADLKKGMLDHFNRGLRKDASTDVILFCWGHIFHVHRNVLTWQCKFFKNAFNPTLGFKEARSGEIEMNDDYYDNIYALLEYLYTYDYKVVLSGEDRGPVPELRFHVKIYATADRYDVPKLKNLARTKFSQTLENARIHDVQDGLYKVLKDVYTTTPDTDRGLRDLVLQYCASHNEMVLGKRKFVKTADRLPGFWKELREGVFVD